MRDAFSGTEVVVVNQSKQLLQNDDKSFFMLVTPANHCWLNFRKGIIDFMKSEEGKSGEKDKAAAAASASEEGMPPLVDVDEDVVPVVVTACMHCACFRTRLLTCSQCMSAFYCTKECQVTAWKRHKKLCKKKVADTAANAAANANRAAVITAGAVTGAEEDARELAATK